MRRLHTHLTTQLSESSVLIHVSSIVSLSCFFWHRRVTYTSFLVNKKYNHKYEAACLCCLNENNLSFKSSSLSPSVRVCHSVNKPHRCSSGFIGSLASVCRRLTCLSMHTAYHALTPQASRTILYQHKNIRI